MYTYKNRILNTIKDIYIYKYKYINNVYIYKNVKKTYINIYIKVKKDSKKFGSINMKGGENWVSGTSM